MAARQNQGFLIWIIVLVIFSLVLALATFLSITKALEYVDLNSQNESQLKIQTALAKANEIQNQIMRAMVGNMGESATEIETNLDSQDALLNTLDADKRGAVAEVINKTKEVYAEYKKDMALLIASGENTPNATYRGVFDSYATALKRKNDDNIVLQRELTRIQGEAQVEIAAKQAEVVAITKDRDKAQVDLSTEQTAHQADIALFQQTVQSIKDENSKKNTDFDIVREAWEKIKGELDLSVTTLSKDNKVLKDKVDLYELENFDRADGSVVRVSDGLRRVVIDRGSADGLRINRSFAIFPMGTTDFVKNRHKATIEVIRIDGAHTAEAQIKMEDTLNPILAGDLILAAAWDPGNSVEIALAGIFDMDFDGKDDRDKLIEDIKRNGGKVVAWHDDDGNIHGEITPSTRYFVMGDAQPPGLDFNAPLAKAALKLKKDAEEKKIQTIDSRKLMEWLGVSLRSPIVPLDDRIGEPFQNRAAAEAARIEAERNAAEDK